MADLFCVSAPGLAPFTANELEQLSLFSSDKSQNAIETGGVNFQSDWIGLYKANLYLRSASRILVRLGEFRATALSELRKKAGRLPWETYLHPGYPIDLRATSHKSRLYHSGAVSERVAGAVADRLGQPSPIQKISDESREDQPGENLPQLVVVRVQHDVVTISIDSSGELLHRRGYRLETAKAPLRETLAAGIILAAGWQPASPFLDPFCGSGTLAIEAAMIAAQKAPGRARRFAFMNWPGFNHSIWQALVKEAEKAERQPAGIIQASDRDAGAIRIAMSNAERAGVSEFISFSSRAVSAIEPPPEKGWVITNPPYGLRVRSSKDLRNLYAQFGNILRAQLSGWHIAVLSSDPRLTGQMQLSFNQEIPLVNGGVRVNLFTGIVPGDSTPD